MEMLNTYLTIIPGGIDGSAGTGMRQERDLYKSFGILVCVLVFVFSFIGTAQGDDITLAWDPNTEANLNGYKVYIGAASRTYGFPITIGTQTSYTVTGLSPGTYFFAVTAYNTSGLESGYSNEVSATIPGTSCDTNGDTFVNVLDLQELINTTLGISQPSSSQDFNGDGSIDVLDLQILANVVLGVIGCPL